MRELVDKNSPAVSYQDSQPVLPPALTSMPDNSKAIDINLYAKAVKAAEKLFNGNPASYNETDALHYILELYQYASNSQHENIDAYFAEWLFKKTYTKT
jgi:hypothetical protein